VKIQVWTVRERVPWWAKIAAKLVLARIPLSRRTWRRLGIFRGGPMGDPGYALATFRRHFERARPPASADGFVALELGPGDVLLSSLVARAHGARLTYLVDVEPRAGTDLPLYQRAAHALRREGLNVPDLSRVTTLAELLAACGARYETRGLASLREIPDGSVDFIWSQAVLEHVRRADFAETLWQLRRIMRPQGTSSHRIDLSDHLAQGLNNLRFAPGGLWESRLFAGSGFYTNQLRYTEIVTAFDDAGFDVEVVATDRWEAPPTPRAALAAPFRDLPDDELLISGFDLVAPPRAGSTAEAAR
jgi:hypothetical protein